MTTDLIPINILIGDRTYRIKTLPSDEELVRKTLKIINDKISEFRSQFAGKDLQDYISMVLIWYATQPTSGMYDDASRKEFADTLEKIHRQLDAVI
ncbi:MAG: cell division protein ZapA [Ginsengibacter sp.]